MSEGKLRRRTLLAALVALAAALAAGLSPISPLPWRLFGRLPGRAEWLAGELARALTPLTAKSPAPPGELGLARDEAVGTLVEGLSRNAVRRLLGDRSALRAHVAARIDADLRSGRTRYVDGWLMADTELAVARLAPGAAAR